MARKRRELPWLETRDGGIYYVFWYDAAKRRTERQSFHTKDSGEATKLYAAFLVEGTDVYLGKPKEQAFTCGRALDDYFREHVQTDAVVDKGRIEDAITLLKEHFERVAVKDVDIPMCRTYADLRRQAKIGGKAKGGEKRAGADGTIRRELGVLQAAAKHAMRWKRIQLNDLPSIELPAGAPAKELYFTEAEMARLRAAARKLVAEREAAAAKAEPGSGIAKEAERLAASARRGRDFIELAYFTAGRRRSIEGLTKFQVSLERAKINLDKAGARKTKKRRPVVPIDPELMPTVRRLMAEGKSEYLLGSRSDATRVFNAAVKAAGLARLPELDMRPAGKPSPHALRHSRATHLLQRGVSPWAVAGLLGDTLATLTRVYGHHCPAHVQAALAGKTGEEEE